MKVVSACAALLLASSAVAAPSPQLLEKARQRRHERLSKRMEEKRGHRKGKTGYPLAVNYTGLGDRIVIPKDVHNAQYDSNWAGAVIVSSGITQVTGTFNVPNISIPPGGSSGTEYGASSWVGIDGDTCQSAILQTGVEYFIENGQASYAAWYEWFPDVSYTFSGFDVSPGDQIQATVQSTSTTSGIATIDNLSTGQSVSHTFSNEGSVGTLCNTNAEWIVEDFESGSQLIPFADFGSVTFTGATYQANGNTNGVSGATILDVEQNNQVVTNCGTSGASGVSCTYTG